MPFQLPSRKQRDRAKRTDSAGRESAGFAGRSNNCTPNAFGFARLGTSCGARESTQPASASALGGTHKDATSERLGRHLVGSYFRVNLVLARVYIKNRSRYRFGLLATPAACRRAAR
jgi:ribosome modulation factor